jgi:hypothetical protein
MTLKNTYGDTKMNRRKSDPAADLRAAKDPPIPGGLKGETPQGERRMKMTLFGDSGVGKTWACITAMPRPYIFDCEAGCDHYGHLIREAGGAVVKTHDIDEVCDELRKLIRVQHPFRTVVIDPLTVLYDECLAVGERLRGTEWSAHYGYANRRMKELMTLLTRVDMNVVCTSHEKDNWQDGKSDGKTLDGWKRTKYAFDLVMHMRLVGDRRLVSVVKSRLEGFPKSETFEWCEAELNARMPDDWSEIANTMDVADEQSTNKLQALIAKHAVPDETVTKWLNKCGVTAIEDMPSSVVQKCIEYLTQSNPAASAVKSNTENSDND